MSTTWQEELRTALSSIKELDGEGFAFLERQNGGYQNATMVEKEYRTLVPRYYLSLIDKKNPDDPIAKLAFPSMEELDPVMAGMRDPIGDLTKKAASRLTHRYPDRALLHVTNLCPMYCRFCFRKNLMNEREPDLYAGDFSEAFFYLSKHPEIEELILTGGDPWMLSNERLSSLVNGISEAMPGLKRLRFHTRMPVTLPMRIEDGLLNAISRPDKFQTIIVTHFNHPQELSELAKAGLQKLRAKNFLVFNQCVLLKGVNNSSIILRDLFSKLGNLGVLPYYLHHCDLVAGGEHFRTSIEEGQKIWLELRGTLPGYFLPEYILDIPGGGGKIPLGTGFIENKNPGEYMVRRHGDPYFYRDPVSPGVMQ